MSPSIDASGSRRPRLRKAVVRGATQSLHVVPRRASFQESTTRVFDPVGEKETAQLALNALAQADTPDRVATDAQMFEMLRRADFHGPLWDGFADVLARHGLGVLEVWLKSGKIFAIAESKGISLRPTAEELHEVATNPELRDQLKIDSVAAAIVSFRRKAFEGTGWSPDGGATMQTYFLTGCLYAFANELGKHRRSKTHWDNKIDAGCDINSLADSTTDADRTAPPPADLADLVADHDVIERKLDELSDKNRQLVLAKARGDTNHQIAAREGVTAKAIDRRWSKLMAEHTWIRALSRKKGS